MYTGVKGAMIFCQLENSTVIGDISSRDHPERIREQTESSGIMALATADSWTRLKIITKWSEESVICKMKEKMILFLWQTLFHFRHVPR